ncbi:hypothetical protein D3C75_984540 [compost metagenome]
MALIFRPVCFCMSSRNGCQMLLRFCEDSVDMMPKLMAFSSAWALPNTQLASSAAPAKTRPIRFNMERFPEGERLGNPE